LQLAGGIVTFVYRDEFETGLLTAMRDLMVKYPLRGTTWDKLQAEVKSASYIH
jgi:hypothetical protein